MRRTPRQQLVMVTVTGYSAWKKNGQSYRLKSVMKSVFAVYVNLKVPSFSVENSPTLKLKYPYVNKTYLHKGLNEGD